MDWIIQILFPGGCLTADPLTIAALVMSLAGNVGSMIGSARMNKVRQQNLDKEKAASNAFFDKEYYTNELDRTEHQSVLRTLVDRLKEQNKQTQATNAITGATAETAIAQQGNVGKTYADAVNRITGLASQRKSALAANRNADRRNLYLMQDQIDYAKAQNWSNLGSNAANLGSTALMAGAYSKGGATTTPGFTPPSGTKSLFEDDVYSNLG